MGSLLKKQNTEKILSCEIGYSGTEELGTDSKISFLPNIKSGYYFYGQSF